MPPYQLLSGGGVLDLETGASIPPDPANSDYQAFLAWDEIPGNDPLAPAPPAVRFTGSFTFDEQLRTTDDQPHEIYRITMPEKVVHQATATIIGIDVGNFAIKAMEGRFVHKRALGNAIQTGIAVLSDLHDSAAASWLPNALPSGSDVVWTVKGAAGRTIDWTLSGTIFVYAPEGEEV